MSPSIFWLIALIALCVGEGISIGLTFIWFAVGALGALISTAFGATLLLQVAIFLVLSALSLVLMRPVAKKFLTPKYVPTNVDRVIGATAVVTEDINNLTGTGLAAISGQVWTARSEHNVVIPSGTTVKVLRIEGVKIFVESL